MKKSVAEKEKITIRGTNFCEKDIVNFELNEYSLSKILSVIKGIGGISRSKEDKNEYTNESLINNSPLLYIEGVVRYQLIKCQDKPKDKNFYLGLDSLQSLSDIHHMTEYVELNSNDLNFSFLFEFLNQIVSLSTYPDHIDYNQLELLKIRLVQLHNLVKPQITGAESHENRKIDTFRMLAHHVWSKNNYKKLLAKQIWGKVISTLKDNVTNNEGIEIVIWAENDENDGYIFCLEDKKGNQIKKSEETEEGSLTIRSKNINTGDYTGRKTGKRLAEKKWPNMQKEFMENRNK